MDNIRFSKEEKEEIVKKVKIYFNEELDQDIGGFDAEFLIDFFSSEVGAYFYNRGVYDAQALLTKKVDELTDMILELEVSTNLNK